MEADEAGSAHRENACKTAFCGLHEVYQTARSEEPRARPRLTAFSTASRSFSRLDRGCDLLRLTQLFGGRTSGVAADRLRCLGAVASRPGREAYRGDAEPARRSRPRAGLSSKAQIASAVLTCTRAVAADRARATRCGRSPRRPRRASARSASPMSGLGRRSGRAHPGSCQRACPGPPPRPGSARPGAPSAASRS